jgi:hypothetical protein
MDLEEAIADFNECFILEVVRMRLGVLLATGPDGSMIKGPREEIMSKMTVRMHGPKRAVLAT